MNSEDALVTIAVPTFDRPEALRRCVARLLEQMTPAFQIIVLDNCSATPAAEAISDLVARHPGARLKVIRHPANIGSVANVLRCFELATTEWLWPLCDDDLIQPGALRLVNEMVRRYPAAAFINSAGGSQRGRWVERQSPVVTRDLSGFIEAMDDFGSLYFLSASLYRRAEFTPMLRIAYSFADCFAPHVCLVLARLSSGPAECVLHPAKVVSWEWPSTDPGWDALVVNRGLYKLIGLVEDVRLCRLLFAKIQRIRRPPLPWWKALVIMSVLGPANQLPHLYDLFLDCYRMRLLAGQRVVVQAVLGLAALSTLARGAPVLRLPLKAYLRLKYGPHYRPEVELPSYAATILKGKRY